MSIKELIVNRQFKILQIKDLYVCEDNDEVVPVDIMKVGKMLVPNTGLIINHHNKKIDVLIVTTYADYATMTLNVVVASDSFCNVPKNCALEVLEDCTIEAVR